MPRFSLISWQVRIVVAGILALAFASATSLLAFASVTIVQISTDPYNRKSVV